MDKRGHAVHEVLTREADRQERGASSGSGRLHSIVTKYLADLIYGANDGIVTTLAIVSGVVGAALPTQAILILGFANLIADGFSMGASNFLSKRTGMKASERPGVAEAARHGSATFLGFVVAGLMPLLAYLIPGITADRFLLAVLLALLTLFVVGASRALFSEERWLRAGLEMFLIGALAAAVAYGIGLAGARFINDGALH
jgi:vacuolar iron transporter family protein